MSTVWKIIKRGGVVVGPIVFLTSVVLAARDIAHLGVSWYWWAGHYADVKTKEPA